MRIFSPAVAILALASNVLAFSDLKWVEEYETSVKYHRDLWERQVGTPQADDGGAPLPLVNPPFDPVAQRVSTTGANAFIAPGSTDIRGECPGLNALANHAYLPRNGVATIQQFIDGTQKGFGMARDLGGFLAFYGAIVDGNGQSWSLLGTVRTGIGGSHHNYECDSSPLKSDLNQYGSLTRTIMSQFYNLYNRQSNAATANYNLAVLRDFRKSRFAESVQKNPWFFYGPFDGIEVSQAAFTFIYRFMSNKSAEHPEGILNKDVLKSFMSIKGNEGSLYHVIGNERIPDNWYKRNPSDEYSIPYFQSDIGFFAQTAPEILAVGCNTGTVNSYNTFSPEQLSGGAYTAAAVAQNPFCYSAALTAAGASTYGGLPASGQAALTALFNPLIKAAGCKPVTNANFTAFSACPGFTFYGGPNGPVAPGAIQTP